MGKGSQPRKFTQEGYNNYHNNKFWDNPKPETKEKDNENNTRNT